MSKRMLWLLAAAMLLPVVPATHADDGEGARHQVLIERNIFSPTRGQRSEPSSSRNQQPRPEPRESQPRDPGRAMVLRGFAVRGEQAVAMIEDEAGTLRRVGVGDTVAGRRITDIAIDRLAYDQDGEARAITIGMNLAGEAAPRPEARTSGDRATGERDSAAGQSSSDRNALLERMRRRRQQIVGDPSPPSEEPEREPAAPSREMLNDVPDETADAVEFVEDDEEAEAIDTGEVADEDEPDSPPNDGEVDEARQAVDEDEDEDDDEDQDQDQDRDEDEKRNEDDEGDDG